MNTRQRKTLKGIFEEPTRCDIKWSDIESLFTYLGASVTEGNGSRVRIKLNGVRAVFHRPHPNPTVKKYAVETVRDFLQEAGIKYE